MRRAVWAVVWRCCGHSQGESDLTGRAVLSQPVRDTHVALALRQPQTSHGALALAIACALVSSCLGLGRLDLAGNGRPCTGAMRLKGGCGFLSVYGSTMDHHSLRMKILQVRACRVHQTATAQSAHAASLPAPTCVSAASCLAHCTVSFEAESWCRLRPAP